MTLQWQTPEQDRQQVQQEYTEHSAPQRACFVCGKQEWQWDGEQYRCGSSDPAHEERAHWAWICVSTQRKPK